MNSDKIIISFGRYKKSNKTINDLFNADLNYCRWLYTQPFIKIHPEIFEFLESKFINDKDIYLEFGKYNKKNLKSSDLPSADLPKELEPTSDIT